MAILLAASFGSAELAAQTHPAPLDPVLALHRLRAAYHNRPIVETVDIVAQSPGAAAGGERKRDSVIVRADRAGEIRAELGDLIIWTEKQKVRAVNRLNAGLYFEAELDPSDRAASFIKVLPPLPIPQVGLVLAPFSTSGDNGAGRETAPANRWDPLPTCTSVRWDTADADEHRGKVILHLTGHSTDCSCQATLIGEPPRLSSLTVKSGPTAAAPDMTITVERLDEPVGKLPEDLRGRTLAASLTDLKPALDDLIRGRVMPALIVQTIDVAQQPPAEQPKPKKAPPLLPEGKCAVVVLLRTANSEVQTAAKLCQKQAADAKAAFRAVGVCSLTDRAGRESLTKLLTELHAGAGAAALSFSARSTIDRFASKVDSVVVVVHADGLIAAVIPLRSPQCVEELSRQLKQ